jgi:hypothetical protein
MRIISITTLILIMLALLTSCTQVNGEEPLQAIVDSPCDPPCWQYIIPGKTSKQEMVELTSRIPEINKQKSEWIGPWNIYNDRYVILFEGNQSEGQIRFIDDEVVSIFRKGICRRCHSS